MFWMSLIAFFLTLFVYQAGTLVVKYKKHDKITSISLKFDQVDFPAITFCNLNPYKKSLVGMVPSIRDTMDVYDNAKSHTKAGQPRKQKMRRREHSDEAAKRVILLFAKEIAQGQEELQKQQMAREGIKRRVERDVTFDPRYEAIEAHCKCVGSLDMECIRFETPPRDDNSKCVCTYDRDFMVAWPCFNMSVWFDHVCPSCKENGYCEYELEESEVLPGGLEWPCKCRNRTESAESRETPYCIGKEPLEIRKLWVDDLNKTISLPTATSMPLHSITTALRPVPTPPETTQRSTTVSTATSTSATTAITTSTEPSTTSTTEDTPTTTSRPHQRAIVSAPETIEAMGFSGMTDGVAMLTKAKENLMFTMSALSTEQRVALSQSKHEFIEMCSFNGHECNIDEDFRIHVDPEFGNCFTFNYDVDNNYTSSRAGPMYGIRVLLFVNTSDYMTTSESAGVRLAIHSPTEYPFPDTFGYSAPVGFASSFGMKKKLIQRLSKPYGDCMHSETYNKTNYIYQQYDYHPEGCHRSCFQTNLIRDCSCGDPRFPVPETSKHCSAFNATARNCLERNIGAFGDFHHVTERMDCECKQRCREVVHEVTFSASRWPSGATDLGDCDGMTEIECENYYRLNAAMVEVFYEQLNYELLQESEAYGLVNLIADFGGHLGLWLGFSVITVMEVIVLILDVISICFRRKNETAKKNDRQKSIKTYPPPPVDEKAKSLVQI
nr:Na+ channel domain containing protein [Haemonchus contortus]